MPLRTSKFDLSRALGPQHGIYRREQRPGFWAEFEEALESIRVEPHEFIEVGDHVVVPWTARMLGRDGIEVEARVTWTYTIQDGAIERVCMYQEEEEALDAVLRSG
jgi:ketosteroid isomerase-like protein